MPPKMVDSHRDFNRTAQLEEIMAKPGPTFDLWDETFHCLPQPPGEVLPRLAAAVQIDTNGRQVYHLPNMTRFIEDCLVRENVVELPAEVDTEAEAYVAPDEVREDADDIERWRALMADPTRPVLVEQLGDIIMWLSEYYGNRPTTRSKR